MLKQFFKFLITGANNTGLDFLILNLLMFSFNTYKGWLIILFNIISFSLAVTNSYLINRFWTFRSEGNKKIYQSQIFLIVIMMLILVNLIFFKDNAIFTLLTVLFFSLVLLIDIYVVRNFLLKESFIRSSLEFFKFVFLTIIGMGINTSVVYTLTSFISPLFGFSNILWANFSKAIATCLTLFWNFFSYKLIIFRK